MEEERTCWSGKDRRGLWLPCGRRSSQGDCTVWGELDAPPESDDPRVPRIGRAARTLGVAAGVCRGNIRKRADEVVCSLDTRQVDSV